ncbi:MAG: cysteine synthase family protein [Candidatus Lokiarchaeota archaeon]|nr:cysteine synthase family protein [Candidatus Lokiarchaeota archaeon]
MIGNTPMVRINRLNENPNVTIYAKLEKMNPGGSVKDRIALYMIDEAEKSGELDKSKIIVEPTSGNTGIGLALVCMLKGYPLELVMPISVSMERKKILTAFGAKLNLIDGSMDQVEDFAKQMIENEPKKYFRPNQFKNKNNYLAHYYHTANEIWADTDGKITHFVAGLGTSGTIMGCGKRFRELNPEIKIIGVEPYPHTNIQGLKNYDTQYIPEIFDSYLLDEKIKIKDEDAFEMARLLTLREGIFSGISSGAAMHVALEIATKIKEGVIVTILPDGGEKYISTRCYDPFACLKCVNKCQMPTCLTVEHLKETVTGWFEEENNK